jgi:predicted dehydrogenase
MSFRRLTAVALSCAAVASTAAAQPRFRFITLDPGHFHAGLVQKFMYPDVDSTVRVYAPAGDDLQQHLARVEAFNTRADAPTKWKEQVYTGADFFDRMLADAPPPGSVVVIAGNNGRKTEYILRSVQAGLNVLGDKPMVRTASDLVQLRKAFDVAAQKHVLLYDIMTERHEVTNALQRELVNTPALFGTLVKGTPENPGIRMESIHYLSKVVSGAQLRRPEWFFDVEQEGEGLQDVGTHLIDLVQWAAFPDQTLKESDVAVLSSRRWPTPITRAEYKTVTGADSFPAFLKNDVKFGTLQYFANGDVVYRLRGVNVRVQATWDFVAPKGSGDQQHALFRGTKAAVEVRQTAADNWKPTLYVRRDPSVSAAAFERALRAAVASLQGKYPGVEVAPNGEEWKLVVPAKYDVGHESHFSQVTSDYLSYLRAGKLPAWEVPNMLVKYATLAKAYELSHAAKSAKGAWVRDAGSLAWTQGDATSWRFVFDTTRGGKAFFEPVSVAGGPSLTNFKPADHPWHYGHWFSWKYINHVNYWEEDRTSGQAAGHTRWSAPQIDARPDGGATIRMNVTYSRPTGETDLTEARRIDISPPAADGSYTIDWTMRFTAGKDGAVLDRTPMPGEPNGAINGGYAGLSVRLAASPLAVAFATTEGPVPEFVRDRARPSAPAAGASFSYEGQPVGAIAFLSDPANTQGKAAWYMINSPAPADFRFMCAAILAPAVKTIPAGGTLDLKYRVALQKGAWTPEALTAAMTRWLGTRSAAR